MKSLFAVLFLFLLAFSSCQKEEVAPKSQEDTVEGTCSDCGCCANDTKMDTKNGVVIEGVDGVVVIDGRRITDPNNDEDEERAKKTQR
ncbi:MAG: hypothetical protein JJT77_11795 [Crocinitomicaceae bacterium]|nr:hypothetical protein [Crocinitomicaceae bacterium]